MRERVLAYVDGFNLHFGIKAKGWRRYAWLDLGVLADQLRKPEQTIVAVKYFTALLSGPGAKRTRQKLFLEANEVQGRCSVHLGQFQNSSRRCPRCGLEDDKPSEKMTDVRIATELLADAFEDRFDAALLITGDSDLAPVVEKLRDIFPQKRIIMAFPPARFSQRLSTLAHGFVVIGRAKLAACQLPDEVTKADGVVLCRPQEWR